MKSWVKLYTEILDDPDQGTLSWAQRGMWSALLALAGKLDHREGERDTETGRLDTVDRIAWHLRCDPCELEEAVAAFTERGMVEERDGVLYLPNYAKRQARPVSARRNAVAQRVRAHRERQAEERNEDVTTLQDDVTSVQRGVTPSDSETDSDTDTDSEVVGADAPAPTAPAALPSPRKMPSGLTVAGKEFFAQFGRQRWGTKAERERFEATEREVGSTVMMAAVRWAAENRIARVPAICSTARKMHQEGTGKPRASPSRARLPPNAGRPEYEDPAVYQRAVEAYERGDTG